MGGGGGGGGGHRVPHISMFHVLSTKTWCLKHGKRKEKFEKKRVKTEVRRSQQKEEGRTRMEKGRKEGKTKKEKTATHASTHFFLSLNLHSETA